MTLFVSEDSQFEAAALQRAVDADRDADPVPPRSSWPRDREDVAMAVYLAVAISCAVIGFALMLWPLTPWSRG